MNPTESSARTPANQIIVPGIGIDRAQALIDAWDAPLGRRNPPYPTYGAYMDELRVALRLAKRKHPWPLPPRLPAFTVLKPITSVSLDLLLAYTGDPQVAERIYRAIETRAMQVAA